MSQFTSYGTCELCGKRTSKAGMTRHLKSCPAQQEVSGRASRLLHLRVEDAYTPFFWMDLEIKADATLEELDDFLRSTWLECCGHLSAFHVAGADYMVSRAPGGLFGEPEERSMEVKAGDVLSTGTRFEHVYDFGTSTQLKLRVAGERDGGIGGDALRLLSRNEAPVWACEECGEAAAWICEVCMFETDNPFYCEAHAEDHDCEEPEMLLPVVNSPRMGVCGYTG